MQLKSVHISKGHTLVLAAALVSSGWARANLPPVADAGPDQSVIPTVYLELWGSAVDPDGDPIVAWRWDVEEAPVGSSPILTDPWSPDTQFAASVEGSYVLSLVASDGAVWSQPDSVAITVAADQPPTAVAQVSPLSGRVPLTVSFDGTGSFDPEGGVLQYRWDFGDGEDPVFGAVAEHTYIAAGLYVARLVVVDPLGGSDSDSVPIDVLHDTDVSPTASSEVTLEQNFPNPFNPRTTIAFRVDKQLPVSLCVFDVSGRLARILIDGELRDPGRHEVIWNGRDDAGSQLASGIYFYRLESAGLSQIKRLVLLK